MRITGKTLLVVPALALALSACGSKAERTENDTRDAGGEVLEGSISDEMIPLDQLRSQGDMEEEVAGEDAEAGDAATPSEAGPADEAPADEAAPDAADEAPGEG